jgi:hypothetical protein
MEDILTCQICQGLVITNLSLDWDLDMALAWIRMVIQLFRIQTLHVGYLAVLYRGRSEIALFLVLQIPSKSFRHCSLPREM